jgi:hypothetical protein
VVVELDDDRRAIPTVSPSPMLTWARVVVSGATVVKAPARGIEPPASASARPDQV